MLHSDGDGRISIEGSAAREHLVHDDAKGIHISGRADDLALSLFGSVVLNSTQGHTGGGQTFSVDIFIDTGNPEVGELDGAVTANQDVLWFNVAVNDASPVRHSQSQSDIVSNDDGAIHSQHPARA